MSNANTTKSTKNTAGNKLGGKVAVITGGAGGIGLATARLFADEGARVVVVGRDAKALEAAAKELGALAITADVRDVGALDAMYRRVQQELGAVDVLFANAGIGPNRMLTDVTPDFFDDVMATNLKGAYFTVQRALPFLAPGASIIMMSSGAAQVGAPGTSVYAASKAAVRSMARTFSAELLQRGVRVNALSPGLTETPAISPKGLGIPEAAAAQFAQAVLPMIPMRRLGRADEIARAALFLACEDSAFVAGSELCVDGGFTQI